MKTIFTKLAEQFKNHLVNTENNRRDVQRRLFGLQKGVEDLRVEALDKIKQAEHRMDHRLRQEKENILFIIDSKVIALTDKTNKLEEELNKDFEILNTALDKNRDLFTSRLSGLVEMNEKFHQSHQKNIQEIIQSSKIIR